MVSNIVLIRGLGRQQRHWGDFATLLQTHWQRYGARQHSTSSALASIKALDLPGMGTELTRPSPCQIQVIAQDLASRLPPGPCHIVAMSLGAMVAVSLAQQFPTAVASLTLINSSSARFSPFYQRLRLHNVPMVIRALLTDPAHRERLILQMTSNNCTRRAKAYPDWLAIALQQPVRRRDVLRQLWAASHFDWGEKPECQLHICASRGDRLVAWQCSAAIANAWQLPLTLHDSAGHDLALDDPVWLVNYILHNLGAEQDQPSTIVPAADLYLEPCTLQLRHMLDE
jgi:pimeloyl-ACP methyl ester carboxylesterase